MSVRRLLTIALVLPVLGIGPMLAAPAGAASPKMTSNGAIRDCIDTSLPGCTSRGTVPKGRSVTMHCYGDDSWATGEYRSDRWFYVTSSTGQKGFVHSSRVSPQTRVGKCRDHRGIAVSRWAAEHVGVAKMTPAEAAAIGYPDQRYWSGFCAGFTWSAYRWGAGVTLRYAGNAKPRYEAYKRAGRMRVGGTMAIGSQVFWPNLAPPLGHVAIYIGNGMVATTMTGGTAKNARVKVSSLGTPAGWVGPGDA